MERRCSETKKGATVAPFLAGEAAYRFLPPFFFPPVFFAIALIPPFTHGIRSRGPVSVVAAPLPGRHVGLQRPVPIASLLTSAIAEGVASAKKIGGVRMRHPL
jgi:hypothetical protein